MLSNIKIEIMKSFWVLCLFTGLFYSSFSQQTVYGFSLPKLEGGSVNLSEFVGKKIIFVTLPLVQGTSADSALHAMDTMGLAHQGDLKIIAVISFEDGYAIDQKSALLQWYRSKLRSHISITDGVYTRNTSGGLQHPLFRWLTTLSMNEVFDIDPDSAGFKFFINTEGKLVGVLRPHSKMWGQSVQKTIRL